MVKYSTVLPSVSVFNFLFLLLYSGCATNHRSVLSGYICRGGHCPLLCSGILLREEVYCVGDEGSGGATTVNVQATLEGPVFILSLKCIALLFTIVTSEHIAGNHYNTLSIYANLGFFKVCGLKRSFISSVDAITIIIGPYISFHRRC